jgi:hypothetical protein
MDSASCTLFIVLDASTPVWRSGSFLAAPPQEQRAMGESRDSSFAFDYPVNLQVGLFLVCSVLLRV